MKLNELLTTNVDKIKEQDAKSYEKVTTGLKWAALVAVAIIILICLLVFL